MATKAEILARMEAGELGADIERELVQALGFPTYTINGVVAGWTDPLTGNVRLVGKFLLDDETALSLLPPGWVFAEESRAVLGGFEWRAKVADRQNRLNQATFTAFQPTRARALLLAIARARA